MCVFFHSLLPMIFLGLFHIKSMHNFAHCFSSIVLYYFPHGIIAWKDQISAVIFSTKAFISCQSQCFLPSIGLTCCQQSTLILLLSHLAHVLYFILLSLSLVMPLPSSGSLGSVASTIIVVKLIGLSSHYCHRRIMVKKNS